MTDHEISRKQSLTDGLKYNMQAHAIARVYNENKKELEYTTVC